MNLLNIIFIGLSAITILSALMVIFTKNPIYSILYLIITMFSLTGHYILLSAQFIAVINIIVYAGAIMVLFLFVLMLLNLNENSEPQKSLKFKLLGIITGGVFMLSSLYFYKFYATTQSLMNTSLPADFGFVKPLGNLLFKNYIFPFEIASILFLASMVGVVFLGTREKK